MKRAVGMMFFASVAAVMGVVADDAFGEWRFVPSENLLTNKVWKLNAYVSNAGSPYLAIGNADESGTKRYHSAYANTREEFEAGLGKGKLDLSGTITDDDGKEWFIRTIATCALACDGSTCQGYCPHDGSFLTEIVFPETLIMLQGNTLNIKNSQLTRVVMNIPGITDNNIGGSLISGIIREAIVKLPNAKSLDGNGGTFFNNRNTNGALDGYDVSEWDFSSLETLGRDMFNTTRFKGRLSFPKIRTIGDRAFKYTALSYLDLGTNGCTVTDVGVDALENNGDMKRMVIGGDWRGWTMETNALKRVANKLELVLPTVPYTVYPEGEGHSVFGALTEKSICIYVPTNMPEWVERLTGKVTPITNGESLGFSVAPFGIVDADVFGTGTPQYIGHTGLDGYGLEKPVTFTVKNPSSEGDTVTATVNGEEIECGTRLVPYTKVTLTANCAVRNTFVRWEGLPEDIISGSATETTVTFMTKGTEINVSLVSAPGWTYYPTEGVISNKIWKLNCYPVGGTDSMGRTKLLRIGKAPTAQGRAWHSAYANTKEEMENGLGQGDLDLSGRIFDEAGTTEWYINGFVMAAFSCNNGNANAPNCGHYGCDHKARVTSFVFPTTLQDLGGGGQFLNFILGSAVTNVVMDVPEYAGTLGGGPAIKATVLQSLVLKVPHVTAIDGNGGKFFDKAVPEMDVSDWDLSRATVFGREIFHESHNFTGTLHLPAVTYFNTNSFRHVKLPALECGMGYTVKDGAELMFDRLSFYGTGLKKMTFGPYKSITVGSEAFNQVNLTNLAFYGACPGKDALDGILYSTPELNTDSPVIIRASVRMPGWKDVIGDDYTSEEENALGLADEHVLGVYKTKDSVRKAWIVDMKSPFDPKGTILIIR